MPFSLGSYVSGQTVSSLESKIGKPLAVVNQFFNWGDDIGSFLSGVGSRAPMATLEPWNYSLDAIANGSADNYLRGVVTDVQAFGKPVYLRPLHEANGNWYPWSVRAGLEQNFIRAWQHMAGVLRGASNARLVWCPNADTVGAAEPNRFYPGSSYVDILAADGYSWDQGGQTFDATFSRIYPLVTGLDSQKPFWVCETGCGEGARKAAWVNSLFATKMTRLRAVVYFSVNKEQDWRMDSSSAALAAFKAGAATTVPLDGVPVPPPPPPPPPPTPPPPPPVPSSVGFNAPAVNKTTYQRGQTISASAKFSNPSSAPVTIKRGVLTCRQPGSTHASGPYYDFVPELTAQTIAAGDSRVVAGTWRLPYRARTGKWDVYATFEDTASAWHDGPSTFVTVSV